jgi:drug/metabolite transporter (DMT)-like permease
VKIGLKYATPMDLLAHRFSAASICLAFLWFFGLVKLPPFKFKKAKYLFLLSLPYPLLFFTLQTFGLQHSSVSEAGIIFATTPIITVIAASIFLKEKTSLLQKIGIILTIVGILYIIFLAGDISGSNNLKGLLLLMLSVFTIVLYYILGKLVSPRFSVIEITVWMIILAFLVFNGFSLITHIQSNSLNQFFEPLLEFEFLWAILYLGILSSLLSAILTNFALSKISASKIAVFNNLSPLISIAGGVFILGEKLYNYHIIGGLLVLIGIAMTIFFKNRKS